MQIQITARTRDKFSILIIYETPELCLTLTDRFEIVRILEQLPKDTKFIKLYNGDIWADL